MKKVFTKHSLLVVSAIAVSLVSCTKLDVKLEDPYEAIVRQTGVAPTPSSLSEVYKQLNQLISQENWFALQEHSTDEIMGPTRGTDWDDFGTWRRLHLHTWDGAHNQVNNVWNGVNGALFQTTLLAESTTASVSDRAEARFLRAYFSYIACDIFGQVQHRPATAAAEVIPEVYTRSQAIDFIIAELEAIIPTLQPYNKTNRNTATREAAQFLLAKAYLNKAVFKQDPTNPAGPFTFAAADMNKVIQLCNAIDANPLLNITSNYWDNFKWDNGTQSSENIFVRNQDINVVWATCMGFHYNQRPSGWNGFVALSDFYNSFGAGDTRRGGPLPGYTEQVGSNVGFIVGQVRGPVSPSDPSKPGNIGDPIGNLRDRAGNLLVLSPDASLFFSTEAKGIRTVKYPLDPSTINAGGWDSKNEFPFFRFADVRLMKAEAILRGGTDAETPLQIVNSIRTARGASSLGTVDLTALLAERARELYLEGWRRNDLVRFEKFNDPVVERPNKSDAYRVVYPIPNIALASNPNLKQNFGY